MSTEDDLQPFLRWIRGICVDESRTYYRRIQAIMNVIHHYDKDAHPCSCGNGSIRGPAHHPSCTAYFGLPTPADKQPSTVKLGQ